MAVTTESLFCHPRAFGSGIAAAGAKPSNVQRAICRVADGLPLGELADDPAVIRSFGGEDAILRLPNEPPKELVCVCCIRGGKSLLAACLAFKIAFTIDLSFMAKGEIARISVVSVDKDKAGAVMGHLMVALELEGGLLGQYLVKNPKPTPERVRIRRRDGRVVEIVIAAGKRAGSSLVSRWTVAAIFDEACRMNGDGAVNFGDMRSGVIARLSLVKGAQLVVISSPWAAAGPVYEIVQKHTGKPSRFLVLVRAPGPDMCPAIWTPEAIEELRADPSKEQEFLCDAMGEFADVESGWLLTTDIDRALGGRADPALPREDGWYYVAAMDPGLRSNSWTLVVLAYRPAEDGQAAGDRFAVAYCRQWTGSRKNPLNAEATLTDIRDEIARYGITEAWTDSFGAEFVMQIAAKLRLVVNEDDSTTAEKDERHIDARSKIVARQFQPTTEPQWRADMLAARVKRTPNGQKLDLPLTRDGRHCDYVPATLLALAKASVGPSHWDRLTDGRRQGHFV